MSILSVLGVVTVGTAAAAVNTHVAQNSEKKPNYQPSLYPTPMKTIYRVAKPTPAPTQTVIVTTEVVDPTPAPEKTTSKAPSAHRLAHHDRSNATGVGEQDLPNPYQTDEVTPAPTPSPSHTKSSGSQYSSNENTGNDDGENDDEYEYHHEDKGHDYEDDEYDD